MSETTTPGAVNPRDLRVSDEEREYVVGLLQRAIGRGLIDLDEFTERTDIAYAAMTRGQLNVVLSDLPGLVHRDAPRPGQGPGNPHVAGGPYTDQRVELVGHYSNVTRQGRWTVPPYVHVRNKYGNTRLDFSEAEFTTDTVHVEVDAKWGSVTVTIPDGAAVDINAIHEVKYGTLEDKTGTNGMPGKPRIVLSGRIHGGNVHIKRARRGCCWGS